MTYEPYPSPTDDARPAQPDWAGGPGGAWRVVVEFANSGDAKPPTRLDVGRRTFAGFEEALAVARAAAFEYRPPDPWSEQGRRVFRDGPHAFLVILDGATTTFHMSVRAVRAVAG